MVHGRHTFNFTPQFAQLFCVRAPMGNTHVSVAYALLPGKQQETYEECLTAILDACLTRDIRPMPNRIVVDYEMAIHNAIKSVISPDISIQGCFFHLTQATWRRIQADGLQARYREDEEIRTWCGSLDGLAFLPVDQVEDGMRLIREEAPEVLSSVIDYFDSTYVTGSYRSVRSDGCLRF